MASLFTILQVSLIGWSLQYFGTVKIGYGLYLSET